MFRIFWLPFTLAQGNCSGELFLGRLTAPNAVLAVKASPGCSIVLHGLNLHAAPNNQIENPVFVFLQQELLVLMISHDAALALVPQCRKVPMRPEMGFPRRSEG